MTTKISDVQSDATAAIPELWRWPTHLVAALRTRAWSWPNAMDLSVFAWPESAVRVAGRRPSLGDNA